MKLSELVKIAQETLDTGVDPEVVVEDEEIVYNIGLITPLKIYDNEISEVLDGSDPTLPVFNISIFED